MWRGTLLSGVLLREVVWCHVMRYGMVWCGAVWQVGAVVVMVRVGSYGAIETLRKPSVPPENLTTKPKDATSNDAHLEAQKHSDTHEMFAA